MVVPREQGLPFDFMWPLWAMFDRAPEGRGDWDPKLEIPVGP